MSYYFNNQKRLLTLLVVLLTKPCISQVTEKKNSFGVELSAALLTKAKITRLEGKYDMKTKLQPVYTIGLLYKKKLNDKLYFHTGFYVHIAKWMYYVKVPVADLPPGYSNENIIYNKNIWGVMSVPLILEKKIKFRSNKQYIVKAGINIRYGGLEIDENTRGSLSDTNGIPIRIFTSYFSGTNNYKPWITFITGFAKPFVLDNKNIFSIGLVADISPTYFFKGRYEITIPNQPVTSGTYKINGTSLGLTAVYVFTGTNKKLVKQYQKKGF